MQQRSGRSCGTAKTSASGQEMLNLAGVGSESNPAQRVYRLTKRAIDKYGNALLLHQYVLKGWTGTLPERFHTAQVIALYCDHATHE